MSLTGRRVAVCAVVFLVALGARVGFFAARGLYRSADTPDYVTLAKSIEERGAFDMGNGPYVRRSPGFPALLAIIGTERSDVVYATVHAILDAAVAGMVVLMVLTFASIRWALVAGLFYSLHPGAIPSAVSLMSETLFGFLLTAGAVLLVWGIRTDRWLLSAAAGIVLGAAALCRPIGVFFAVACAVVLWRSHRKHAVAFALATIIAVAPWVIRTSRLAGSPVLVQTGSSANLYLSTRLERPQPELGTIYLTSDPFARRYLAPLTPREAAVLDRALMSEAWENIRQAPADYLRSRLRWLPGLALHSFPAFTGADSGLRGLIARHDLRATAAGAGLYVVFALLPCMLALSAVPTAGRAPAALVATIAWAYTLILHVPMYVEPRYWQPVVPLVVVSATWGGLRLAAWWRHSDWRLLTLREDSE